MLKCWFTNKTKIGLGVCPSILSFATRTLLDRPTYALIQWLVLSNKIAKCQIRVFVLRIAIKIISNKYILFYSLGFYTDIKYSWSSGKSNLIWLSSWMLLKFKMSEQPNLLCAKNQRTTFSWLVIRRWINSVYYCALGPLESIKWNKHNCVTAT